VLVAFKVIRGPLVAVDPLEPDDPFCVIVPVTSIELRKLTGSVTRIGAVSYLEMIFV
jgi:hypothetical protein